MTDEPTVPAQHRADRKSLRCFRAVRGIFSAVRNEIGPQFLTSVPYAVYRVFSKNPPSSDTVRAISALYQPYEGRPITPPIETELAVMPCAHFKALNIGELVLPSPIPENNVPTAFNVVSSDKLYQGGSEMVRMRLLLYSGVAAGKTIIVTVKSGFADYLSIAVGLKNRLSIDGEYSYLLGVCGYAWFDVSDTSSIKIKQVTALTNQRTYNRSLVGPRVRFNVDLDSVSERTSNAFECPQLRDCECVKCPNTLCMSSFSPEPWVLAFP